MASREAGWWSRSWSAVAALAFAAHFGASVFEAVVIAPLWTADPPKSVNAWNALALKPDSSTLLEPLVAVIVVATVMSWMSGISVRGWRRWWLTLALAAAGAVAAITVLLVMPAERELFGAGSAQGNAATTVAWTGEWIRAAAMRLGALLVGMWAAYRAQLSGFAAERATAAEDDEEASLSSSGRIRRTREFAFGDESEPEMTLGIEPENARQRWRQSLAGRRRTAKK